MATRTKTRKRAPARRRATPAKRSAPRSRGRGLANNKAIKNGLAALVGGASGALIGGLLVKSGVKPATAAVGVTIAGGVGTFTMTGASRAAASGMAAAGAGQLALGWLAKVRQGMPEGQALPAELAFPAGYEEPAQLGIGEAFADARNSYMDEYESDDEFEVVLEAA